MPVDSGDGRPPVTRPGGPLERVRDPEQPQVVAGPADELETDR
jgi:hypothetical protein